MNIQEQIDNINSLELDKRINFITDLINISNSYILGDGNHSLGLNIINCLSSLRTSRFIESDTDIKLLDISLRIARKLKGESDILKGILNDLMYYSNFYPEKYNKETLQNEIDRINKESPI
ncbi:MAG: hypothetical protein ABIP51_07740 [Bacteroidia bacterium]